MLLTAIENCEEEQAIKIINNMHDQKTLGFINLDLLFLNESLRLAIELGQTSVVDKLIKTFPTKIYLEDRGATDLTLSPVAAFY
ncbi:MAG: hypothetical protein EOP33_00290 [Rickettsiaceae bacterium]|nr:MAG: hypothetical protein EOP33_00290 [Rickettsiaceae bacterium]